MPHPDRVDRIGALLANRFSIEALIGSGAMAHVYRAIDRETGLEVAVKILRENIADESAQARFAREGEVQAKLRNRNVAAMLATGITDLNEPYLVVELLRGTTMRHVIKSGVVEPKRAVDYIVQALHGLAAVHEAGVLHRDLKPANIMLEPSGEDIERIVLIDFGFATFEGGSRLTKQGMVVGSLTYIAPERLRGEPIDQRSDIYALGIVLYELLTGTPPFVSDDDYDLIDMQLNEPPPLLHELDATLPACLQPIISCALEKQQIDRYPAAIAMMTALEQVAAKL